jgi:hypothetical protein
MPAVPERGLIPSPRDLRGMRKILAFCMVLVFFLLACEKKSLPSQGKPEVSRSIAEK